MTLAASFTEKDFPHECSAAALIRTCISHLAKMK